MLKKIFEFLNDIFLKMTWLENGVNYLLLNVFKMEEESLLFSSLSFFIYDVFKIFILLSVLIYLSSYVQTYFTVERTRAILSKFKGV